tara:strand:+ start:715 stop:1215 length:501 start_codon:yes stop_codon:yes gene_type:complete
MLSQIERYSYMGEEALLFKPKLDERYQSDYICSHTGQKREAIRVQHGNDIRRVVSSLYGGTPSVVAIDEAFMIPGSGFAATRLFKEGHTILVSSLQLSSDGSAYEEIQEMFPYATYVAVCPAVDPISKQDAYYTEKYGGRKDHAIEVGGAEMYRPRDWNGFFGGDE